MPTRRGQSEAAPPRESHLNIRTWFFSGKTQLDFHVKIDPWSIRKKFQTRSWSRFANKNRWPISKQKSGIDFDRKIADRFSYENRIPIFRSICGAGCKTVFQSRIDFKMKFGDRFWSGNRWSIPEWKSITDFSGIIFNRDHDRDENFQIKVWLKNFNQSPLKIF